MGEYQGQVDPVQEKAKRAFAEWEPHLHKLTPFGVAGILNDIECKYLGERHEDFCKMIHFLGFEYYRKMTPAPTLISRAKVAGRVREKAIAIAGSDHRWIIEKFIELADEIERGAK